MADRRMSVGGPDRTSLQGRNEIVNFYRRRRRHRFALQDLLIVGFGCVDMVVNNKGNSGLFEELSDSQIRTQTEVNFFGLIDVARTTVEAIRD